MQKLSVAIRYIFILVLSAIIGFYLYGVYRNFIMYLFDTLQSGRITIVGKNFYIFPPVVFVASLGAFSCIMVYTLQKSSRKLLLIFISLLVFFTSSVLTTWLDSTGKIIECTACNDGRRTIFINDIAFSAHFVAALFFAAAPFAVAYWKSRRNNVDKA
jgi:hypothetical protein